MKPLHHLTIFVLMLSTGLMLSGCMVETRRTNPWGDLEAMAERENRSGDGRGHDITQREHGWAILLGTFEGPRRARMAQNQTLLLRQHATFDDLWVRDDGQKAMLLRGRYDHPMSPRIQSDLRQVRMVEIDGQRPYENVQIISLVTGRAGAASQHDLSLYPGFFSVQVAFFDEAYGNNWRETAEQYAQILRSEKGEDAYYYHGPNRSMVTIGLFTHEHFATQTNELGQEIMTYGPAINEVRRRHPYNVGNGHTIIERRPGQPDVTQPSFLVRVNE